MDTDDDVVDRPSLVSADSFTCVCNHNYQAQSADDHDDEEDDDITLRLSLVSADSSSHLCVFVPLEILQDDYDDDYEKL